MIKSWHKYNESSRELTYEMVLDVIYFRNCSLFQSDDVQVVSNDIDQLIDKWMSDYLDFSSEDTIFIDREGYRKTQTYIQEIFEVAQENPDIKNRILSIYDKVKHYLGKTTFSDYEEILVEYIDDGFDVEYLFKPNDCMQIEIKKVADNVEEHINCLTRANSTVKRIAKMFQLNQDAVYISSAEYTEEGSHIETHVKIIVL